MNMKQGTGSNSFVFLLAVIITLVLTATFFVTLRPEIQQEESSIIIFRPPDNAS